MFLSDNGNVMPHKHTCALVYAFTLPRIFGAHFRSYSGFQHVCRSPDELWPDDVRFITRITGA